jgi:hypothetical protein
MFDQFKGQESLPPEQKLYLSAGTQNVILPSSNMEGFLASKSPPTSCLRAFVSNKEWNQIHGEIRGNVSILETEIPFTADGKPVVFDSWNGQIIKDERMARPSKTARVMATRPVLRLPWELEFTMVILENETVKEAKLKDWFVRGGYSVGLCANRPTFGKFEVTEWDTSEIEAEHSGA